MEQPDIKCERADYFKLNFNRFIKDVIDAKKKGYGMFP